MPDIASSCFDDIEVGETAQFEVVLTDELVARFAGLSGDMNPLHMDEAYAKSTPYGERVVHGMLGASLFSRLVGMHLPGRFALYLSQDTLFREPMHIGMTIEVRGTVVQKIDSMRTIKIKTQIMEKESRQVLVDGEALVKLLA